MSSYQTPIPPLNWQTPIVNTTTGNPSPQFIQLWQSLFQNSQGTNSDVTEKADKTTEISAGTGLDGGGDLSEDRTIDLADTAVTPGTYGDATNVPQIVVDQQGRLTSVTEVAITGGGGGSTGNYSHVPDFGFPNQSPGGVGYCIVRGIWFQEACTIYAVSTFVTQAYSTGQFRPGVYALNSTGGVGTLVATGPQRTGVTQGVYDVPLTTPYVVAANTFLYLGLQIGGLSMSTGSSATADSAYFPSTGALVSNPGTVTYSQSVLAFPRIAP